MDVPQLIAGRFRIEAEIGTGGMGTVYRATHLGLERPVAIKIIKPEFAANQELADRFLREARTMARLRHTHAATIFDVGTLADGRHFIIMEFVDGPTLSEVLLREGRFTAERAIQIAIQICEVLAEAHRLGIIHRDLKPSNIMLSERGVCVLDFGVAKVLAASHEGTNLASTGSGQIVGTPRYMSPEQCLGQRVGARSDLYSLGVLLFEMLAGRPPFTDVLPSAVLVKQATVAPPPLPKLRPDVPRALAMAVHTLLAKRPENRPRMAEDARAMLVRSLRSPERRLVEVEPLSTTVAFLGTGGGLVFRIGAPLSLVLAFSAALLAWGYSSESASKLSGPANPSMPLAGAQLSIASGVLPQPASVRALRHPAAGEAKTLLARNNTGLEDAKKRIAPFLKGQSSVLEIVPTPSGSAIIAVVNPRRRGAAQYLAFEKRRGKLRIATRGDLDVRGFRNASWKIEKLDTDEDGYPDILFVGSSSLDRRYESRLILYVPSKRRSYSMFLTGKVTARGTPHIVWSPSCAGTEAAIYRAFLRQRARALLGLARS